MSKETFQAPEPEQLGELLPAYELQHFIAQGGMGAVYKAVQSSLDRDVAIKILPREFGEDPEFRESFEKEAKAMAKLNHPNLIGVHDYGQVDGMPYIVMENVDGKSLYHSSWGKVIDPQEACRIVKGICDGLAHAHDAGLIHRDIKPANILLNSKAEPKIGDFGLVQATDQEESGLLMGTPGYAAPELLRGDSAADERTDIYAVGVILHELLTGERATADHPPQKATGNLKLDALWRKAVHADPKQRYQSAGEMSEALEDWIKVAEKQTGGKALATAGATASPRPVSAAGSQAPEQDSSDAPAPPQKPAESPKIFLKLVIIVLLAGAVYFTYQKLVEYQDKQKEAAEQEASKPSNQQASSPEGLRRDPARRADPQPTIENSPLVPDDDTGGVARKKLERINPLAQELIVKAQDQRDTELEKNAKSLLFKLETWTRSINNIDRKRIKPKVEEVKNATQDKRVPAADAFTWDQKNRYEKQLEGIVHNRYKNQTSIEEDYRSQLTQLQKSYIKQLKSAGRDARSQGDQASVETLIKAIEAASGDSEAWADMIRGL